MPTEPKEPAYTPAPVAPPEVPGLDLGKSTSDDFAKTNTALDDLLKSATADKDEPPVEPAAPVPVPDPATPPAPPVLDPAKPGPDPATPAAPAAPEPDEFDKVEMPPHTKPASVTAFATVKQLARERLAAVEKEKAELVSKLTAAEEAAKSAPAPETAKELEELRQFRLKYDVEADPSFKTWDKTVKDNEDLIYAKLKTAGVDAPSLKKIEELGGPSQVDWEAISEKFPVQVKRYIEGKLFENEDLVEKKKLAIEKAKANASEFVRTRQEEIYQNSTGRQTATEKEFNAMLPKIEWLKVLPVPATAKPEEKARIESNNALSTKVLSDVKEALNDDSPQMRAILIAGFAQLMRLRAESDSTKAGHSAEIAKLQATLKERDDFIARIKKSGSSRAPGNAPAAAPAHKASVNEDATEALDRHLKEALAAAE